jgi:hypothetical protein
VLRALPLCTCCRHYPGTADGSTHAHSSNRISLPRYGRRVGLCNDLFEACSAFTHVAACTLALSPYFVTCFTGGFNHFVTSTVAPVASGWSGCRVGLSPTGKAPPLHGARQKRPVTNRIPDASNSQGLIRVPVLFRRKVPVGDRRCSSRHQEPMTRITVDRRCQRTSRAGCK